MSRRSEDQRGEIDAVLDATDPFDAESSRECAAICTRLGIPYLQFLRPSWRPGPRDRWTFLNDEAEAARHAPENAVILLNTGRHNLAAFAGLQDRTVWVRVREPGNAPFPFERGGFLHRPVTLPVANEMAGLRSLGVDFLVSRNMGGGTDTSMLEAAARLEVPVGMIRRPPQPEVPRSYTVTDALAWVRRRL